MNQSLKSINQIEINQSIIDNNELMIRKQINQSVITMNQSLITMNQSLKSINQSLKTMNQ